MDERPRQQAAEISASLASRRARFRWQRLDPGIREALALVAAPLHLAPERLLAGGRGPARHALARQLAMYLSHVVLGHTLTDIGSAFGRDRSTASHACAKIEDMRDRANFDAWVDNLEAELERRLAAGADAGEPSRAAG